MRLVVQRVKKAEVKVFGEQTDLGKIGKGLFVLVGVGEGDAIKDAEVLAEKLGKLRIMSDKNDKMNLSVKDVNGGILVVSQFTLLGETSKGNRPSFVKAARPEIAERIYENFISKLKEQKIRVETGKFGANMEIKAVLDGPVTIVM